jgi:hypothetical protein
MWELDEIDFEESEALSGRPEVIQVHLRSVVAARLDLEVCRASIARAKVGGWVGARLVARRARLIAEMPSIKIPPMVDGILVGLTTVVARGKQNVRREGD